MAAGKQVAGIKPQIRARANRLLMVRLSATALVEGPVCACDTYLTDRVLGHAQRAHGLPIPIVATFGWGAAISIPLPAGSPMSRARLAGME